MRPGAHRAWASIATGQQPSEQLQALHSPLQWTCRQATDSSMSGAGTVDALQPATEFFGNSFRWRMMLQTNFKPDSRK
jgi:hypothetical protein